MRCASVLCLTLIATTVPLCLARLPDPRKEITRLDAGLSRLDTRNVVCYFGSWAAYRPDKGAFTAHDIDPTICTHIIYGSLGIDDNATIAAFSPEVDFESREGLDVLKKLHELRRDQGPKLLVSVGGSQVASDEFSVLCGSLEARSRFVASVIKFLRHHKLDGIDIDWQFPAATGGVPSDKANFPTLLRELKSAARLDGFLVSAQVASAESLIEVGYDIRELAKHLDLINVMAYDYQERRSNRTRLIAPLYQPIDESTVPREATVDWSINRWIKGGAPRDKLNLGVTSYATSYTLDDSSRHYLDAPASKLGAEGQYTLIRGLLGYNEVCRYLKRAIPQPNWRTVSRLNRWTVVRESRSKSVYAHRANQWVAFESPQTMEQKASYAVDKGLAGLMIYGLDTDDFTGYCSGVRYPLTRAIVAVLNQQIKPAVRNSTTTTAEIV